MHDGTPNPVHRLFQPPGNVYTPPPQHRPLAEKSLRRDAAQVLWGPFEGPMKLEVLGSASLHPDCRVPHAILRQPHTSRAHGVWVDNP